MTLLGVVLVLKIALTLTAFALPLLLFSQEKLEKLFQTSVQSRGIFRLYGIALVALTVGYASAFSFIQRGDFPYGIVLMGLVSNGGAAAYLVSSGEWRKTLLAVALTASAAMALGFSLIFPEAAIRPW